MAYRSQLTASVRDCGRLAGLPPPPAPAPAFREGVDVLLPGIEEIEKVRLD